MSSRPPLSTSRRGNIFKPSDDIGKDAEYKLKKALAGLAEERRKRAEVEGIADGLRRDKALANDEVERVKRELESEIKAQKTTIMRLSESSAARPTQPDFDARLQALIEKHNQSKLKYEAELHDSRTSNISLQSLITSLQSNSISDRQTITDLRSERALLKKELESERSKPPPVVVDVRSEEMHRFKAERRVWREEKLLLEGEVKSLRKANEGGEGYRARVEELDVQVEGLKGLLRESAEVYGSRMRDMIDRSRYEIVREKLELERAAKRVAGRELRDSKEAMKVVRAENEELREGLEIISEERDTLAVDLTELLGQRRADRAEQHLHPSLYTSDTEALPSNETDMISLLDLAISHNDLVTSYTNDQITSTDLLSSQLSSALSSLSTTRTSLSTLQSIHASIRAELDAMLSAHSDCGEQIQHWRFESIRATVVQDRLKSELCDTRVELKRVEEQAKGDREALRRANESTARWGSARVAMEEELESLRIALQDSRDLEEKYNALIEETEILRSREAMALDEADRLGVQNSELIGHGNGVQKISYVEGLRREMALIKHELATTRHHLNSSLSQISTLTSEIEALKSIAPSLVAFTNGAGRVRVTRRQPEGGEVLGASVARRSVSTSVSGGGWVGR